MAWESRRGGQYYYQKKRIGGRVVSEYVGVGAFAQALSCLEAADQTERAVEQEWKREARRREEEADAALDAVTDMATILTTAALLAAGCHTHRGQWRRRRGQS